MRRLIVALLVVSVVATACSRAWFWYRSGGVVGPVAGVMDLAVVIVPVDPEARWTLVNALEWLAAAVLTIRVVLVGARAASGGAGALARVQRAARWLNALSLVYAATLACAWLTIFADSWEVGVSDWIVLLITTSLAVAAVTAAGRSAASSIRA